MSAVDDRGQVAEVTPEGAIVLSHGDFVAVAGEEFRPGSDVVVWLFSTPRQLGVVRVRGDGAFSQRLRITNDVELGQHTIQVNGFSKQGAVRSLNLAVVVRSASVATSPDIGSPTPATEARLTSRSASLPILVVVVLVAGAFAAGLLMPRRRSQ